MKKLNNYILSNFSTIFFPIFFTLFTITSIIFLIKIASASALFKINFAELLLMYTYMLPLILFFSIPIVFFASAVVSLSKLSQDSELIVLFSLGISPNKLVRAYLGLAVIVSLLLFILSLGLIPISKQLNKAFIAEKKANASLNINSGEFGQKFGEWYIFTQKDNTNLLNIVLFNEDSRYDNFIVAKKAESINNNGVLQLALSNGKALFVKPDELNQITFNTMVINNSKQVEIAEYRDIVSYWSKIFIDNGRLKDFATYILISLFPLLSLFLIVLFGVVNPRFIKNYSTIYMISATLVYFVLVFVLAPNIPFLSIVLVPIVWLSTSYLIYRKYTLSRF